ncbi:hypothetical protein RHGRI_026608 [Rhododendron griersonianum]|uniref:Uncharacterized protein n=1 Tax=Rhododendron griersonianum TaxID=479676 RepID=A0AAV6ITB9_9ERIC|nr:hypothetical protein RHGRI_026608 [Rhododendron griersonianum]
MEHIVSAYKRTKTRAILLDSDAPEAATKLPNGLPPCGNLGIAARHGYFIRLKQDEEWETCVLVVECSWKQIAEPIMKLYTETTDGSTIENRELHWSGVMRMRILILGLAMLRNFLIILKACLPMNQLQSKAGKIS